MTAKFEEKQLQVLTRRGLSLLHLSSTEWDALEEKRRGGTRFSLVFPHGMAHNGRTKALVLIAVGGESPSLRLGLIGSILANATLASRVVFDLVSRIVPETLEELLAQVAVAERRAEVEKLAASTLGLLPVSIALGDQLIRLLAVAPDNAVVLQRILSVLDRPEQNENARALQEEAVSLALKAFGAVDGATKVALPGGDTAIGTVRLHEDAVIEHDARWIPGWSLIDSALTGKAVFIRQNEQLEVFTANKRPLEELFGVDLIYLHKARGALVMVQYKMMEPEPLKRKTERGGGEEREWFVPIDEQFKSELKRMSLFTADLSPEGPYRLNSGPFFFKLVKRHAPAKSPGIMLSLDHLNQMTVSGALSGPRGGLRISYRALDGHYLRSEPFVELLRSGYIGTRGGTTEHLQTLIDATLTGGRGVVAAVQSTIPKEGS